VFAGRSLFFAYGGSTFNATNNIIFRGILDNVGNDYDCSTGVYTCRIPGTYWFTASLGKFSFKGNLLINCFILVNDYAYVAMQSDLGNYNNSSVDTVSGSGGMYLSKGDSVSVGRCKGLEHINNDFHTHFSGVLITPDV